jgi:hypothetical protein
MTPYIKNDMIIFECSHCGRVLAAKMSKAGTHANCPNIKCDGIVRVPTQMEGLLDLNIMENPPSTPTPVKEGIMKPDSKKYAIAVMCSASFTLLAVLSLLVFQMLHSRPQPQQPVATPRPQPAPRVVAPPPAQETVRTVLGTVNQRTIAFVRIDDLIQYVSLILIAEGEGMNTSDPENAQKFANVLVQWQKMGLVIMLDPQTRVEWVRDYDMRTEHGEVAAEVVPSISLVKPLLESQSLWVFTEHVNFDNARHFNNF